MSLDGRRTGAGGERRFPGEGLLAVQLADSRLVPSVSFPAICRSAAYTHPVAVSVSAKTRGRRLGANHSRIVRMTSGVTCSWPRDFNAGAMSLLSGSLKPPLSKQCDRKQGKCARFDTIDSDRPRGKPPVRVPAWKGETGSVQERRLLDSPAEFACERLCNLDRGRGSILIVVGYVHLVDELRRHGDFPFEFRRTQRGC